MSLPSLERKYPQDLEESAPSQALLADGASFANEDVSSTARPARYSISTVLIQTAALVGYTILVVQLVLAFMATREKRLGASIYSPASEAIQYQTQSFVPDDLDNPFAGDPRPEHDQAWADILENIHIRVSEGEMQKLNRSSLALNDGGYMIQLGAYHELHCVKWIRKWIHRDYYWPYLEGTLLGERKTHIEHCLELMRLNAMCRGSLDVTTFEWVGSQPKPVSSTNRECINWESFDNWNHERRLNISDLEIFKDRPQPQEWELFDHEVRLGEAKGDTHGFEGLIEGKITDESQETNV